MATPTKTVSRANVSPQTKQFYCLVCYQKVERADYRRKLLTSKGKTNACVDLELLLGAEISQITKCQQSLTNIVCRNCATKNSNYVKQIHDVRQKFKNTQEILQSKGQVTSVKRMCRPENPERASSKRPSRELFRQTETDCSSETLINQELSKVSTVNVSIWLFVYR